MAGTTEHNPGESASLELGRMREAVKRGDFAEAKRLIEAVNEATLNFEEQEEINWIKDLLRPDRFAQVLAGLGALLLLILGVLQWT